MRPLRACLAANSRHRAAAAARRSSTASATASSSARPRAARSRTSRKPLTGAQVTAQLYAPEHPEPDLIIRTSGGLRLLNFLLWQGACAEVHFCDAYWPAFREIDFLRAMRNYAGRQRRFGA